MYYFLIVLCLLCSACHNKEAATQTQVVRISVNAEPISLDPRSTRNLDGVNILHMLFEGLTRKSLNGEVELAIAKEVEVSDDGLRYVFHLRPTHWSNGTSLTASDFVSSWKTILDPQFPTDIACHLFPIKNGGRAKSGAVKMEEVGIYAPDPLTLIVELEQPTPYFLELLTMPPFFPVSEHAALQNPRWACEAETFVSNGPFAMKSWGHSDQISLVKNPHYWGVEEVCLDQVDLIVASDDTALRMYEEGKIDWTGSPLGAMPIDAVKELREKDQLCISPFLATFFLRVNIADSIGGKRNDLSNLSLRRALALALDRRSIAEHLLQGGQQAAEGFVPPEMELNPGGYFSDNDLPRALEWLQKAKGEIGVALEPIRISYYKNERNAAIVQAMQKQWEEKLQISVEIEAVEPKVYFQRISKREFQLATGSWTADFHDPVNFLEVFKNKDNGMNNTGWEDPEYIDLLNRSQLCRDLEERKQLLREAESILMDQMPLIPIYHLALNYLKRDELDGVFLSPLGHLDLRWAHWELDRPSLPKR
jgi:oligopeptide transport system substrate-binding protein